MSDRATVRLQIVQAPAGDTAQLVEGYLVALLNGPGVAAIAGEHMRVAGEARLRGDDVERQLGQLQCTGVALLALLGWNRPNAIRADVGPA